MRHCFLCYLVIILSLKVIFHSFKDNFCCRIFECWKWLIWALNKNLICNWLSNKCISIYFIWWMCCIYIYFIWWLSYSHIYLIWWLCYVYIYLSDECVIFTFIYLMTELKSYLSYLMTVLYLHLFIWWQSYRHIYLIWWLCYIYIYLSDECVIFRK